MPIFKNPLIWFCLTVLSFFLHNAFFGLFKVEEPVFFILTFVSGLIFLITFLRFLINSRLNKGILGVVLLAILLLDWAALDDITTGNEPNYFGEYAMLVLSIPFILVLGYLLLRKKSMIK